MNDSWAEDRITFTSNILDQFDIMTRKTGFHGMETEQVYIDLLEKEYVK